LICEFNNEFDVIPYSTITGGVRNFVRFGRSNTFWQKAYDLAKVIKAESGYGYQHTCYEILRYGELKRRIRNVTHKMLSAQLSKLESDGIIIRRECLQALPKVEYSLALKGESLVPIINYYMAVIPKVLVSSLKCNINLKYILLILKLLEGTFL
jgi:DNA-binding HxlR family transcriptional regulator